ncbi:penicillin-binding protein 2 [Pelagibaculum spongiae]|nr:penicillin-binding protein 2 [Pelagibaculum spongiae]
MAEQHLKDPKEERRIVTQRSWLALIFMLLMLLMLVARMGDLQVRQYGHFETLSERNRISIQPVAPRRGLIYDRNGVLLAENLPTWSLDLVPERSKDVKQVVEALSKLIDISEQQKETFFKQLRRKRRFQEVQLRGRLTEQEVAFLSVNKHRFPEMELNARLVRHYPLGAALAHNLGYVGRINVDELTRLDATNYAATRNIGKLGVEKQYEPDLHGQIGFRRVETNVRGRVIRVLEEKPPVPGKDLVLNIDARVQLAAVDALAGRRGSVVAIDPRDGGVLAMVSSPSFDANWFVGGIDYKNYNRLKSNLDQPLFNRALRGQYPPASTFKPFMGLLGLESGTVDIHTKIQDPGWFSLPNDDHRYRDWKARGHGHVDLQHSLSQSCDTYYYHMAWQLGIDKISAFMDQFGFGRSTGIDLGEELYGILPSREWKRARYNKPWYQGETVIVGIGQGYLLSTPLQLAHATAALSMKGQQFQPRMARKMLNAEGQESPVEVVENLPIVLQKKNAWKAVIAGMEAVVHSSRGTGRRAALGASYRMAGKTGTAQVFTVAQEDEYVAEDVADRLKDHGLFTAWAPLNDPKIAIAVIVENGESGGAVAGPVARKVMDAWLLNQPDQSTFSMLPESDQQDEVAEPSIDDATEVNSNEASQ